MNIRTICQMLPMGILFMLSMACASALGAESKTNYTVQDMNLCAGATKVADETATGGFCAHMKNDWVGWGIQAKIDSSKLENVPGYARSAAFTAYLVAKVKYTRPEAKGTAFHFGLYDGDGNKNNFETAVSTKDTKDSAWQTFDMGDFHSSDIQLFYVSGGANPENVSDIYVDRFYFVSYDEKIREWAGGKSVHSLRGIQGLDVRVAVDGEKQCAGETVKVRAAVLKNGEPDSETSVQFRIDDNYSKVERFGKEWRSTFVRDKSGRAELVVEVNGEKKEAGRITLNFAVLAPVKMEIASPSYNDGALYLSCLPREIVVRLSVSEYGKESAGSSAVVSVEQGGRVLGVKNIVNPSAGTADIAIPLTGRPQPGKAMAVVKWLENGRRYSTSKELCVYPAGTNEVLIDERQNITVGGRIFFPMFTGPHEVYPKVKEMGFNCTLFSPWKLPRAQFLKDPGKLTAMLDEIEKNGLMVMVDISDYIPTLAEPADPEVGVKFIEAAKNHPALLGWYLKDEPYGWWDELYSAYRTVKALDPYHPVFVTEGPGANWNDLVGRCCDLLLVDPYPIPTASLTWIPDSLDMARRSVEQRKPAGIWLQAFKEGRLIMPTAEEESCMTYLSIIGGTRMLGYFGAHQVLPLPESHPLRCELGKIAKTLGTLMPELLSGERLPDVRPGVPDPGVYTGAWKNGEILYLIVVNTDYLEKHISVVLPPPFNNLPEAERMFSNGTAVPLQNGAVNDRISSIGVNIYKLPAQK